MLGKRASLKQREKNKSTRKMTVKNKIAAQKKIYVKKYTTVCGIQPELGKKAPLKRRKS